MPHPATPHLGKVTLSEPLPETEEPVGTTPRAPTQTHHKRPGYHVQLRVQLKQVEDEDDDCHQPEEDSDEHHPAIGRVQVVWGVSNQGPHQQAQHLQRVTQGRSVPEPPPLRWRPQTRGLGVVADSMDSANASSKPCSPDQLCDLGQATSQL